MSEIQAAKRIESLPVSIFSTMSKLAVQYNAVNLGQGFPDFDGPPWIIEHAHKAMLESKNQYAPMNGILSLRKNIADITKSIYGLERDPDKHITITAGATEALFSSIHAFIESGDEVIMFEPFYDSHQADVILAGGVPVYVTLQMPDFSFAPEELEKAITSKTKMIIVNNPHNPTGKTYTLEELEIIARLAKKHDLIVLSDEVYEYLTFDDVRHIPMVSLPEMQERTITISSTGKTFGMTGWKVGYAIANEKFTKAIQGVHQWATFAVNTPGQHAMAYGFTQLEGYLPEFRALYRQKRDLLYNGLLDTEFKPHKPTGSYFMMVDIPNSAEKNDIDCATELVKEFGIATIPPSVFYGKSNQGAKMLRLCFAKQDSTIMQGIEKLKNYKY